MTSFYGIGLMSGTSIDGLDICYAEFTGDVDTDVWGYRILRAMTLDYTPEWREKLRNASNLSGLDLIKLHVEYGRYLGETVDDFIDSEDAKPCFVASHGHTVFHQPGAHLTFQLGDGETSAAYLHCPFVCNFRSKDVALGGQGAPLVSVGERHLFSHVDVCINLGGVANLSLKGESGHDVCGCNIVLNMLAEKHDNTLTHDVDGQIANSGEVLEDVLSKLESLDYYKMKPPKSLGLEWITENVFPILDTSKFRIADLMCTYCEHIARQLDKAACETAFISKSSDTMSRSPPHRGPAPVSVLVTGGGVFNRCVIDRLDVKLRASNMVLADREIDTVQFKEALLFAFLGLRCLLGLQNVNSEATGSSTDTVSGSIHLPPHHNSHNHSRVGFSLRRSSSTD